MKTFWFTALAALLLAVTGCDREDQGADTTTHVEPERLNDRPSHADQASERKPTPEQLGTDE